MPLRSEHRIHHIVAVALLQQQVAQALYDEGQHGLFGLGGGLDGQVLRGGFQPGAKVKVQVPCHQVLHQTEGGAALGEGVFGAGRRQPGGKQPHEGIQAVGDAHGEADFALGHFVAGEAGQVVLVDGVGHRGVFAAPEGVIAPHDALQGGHFHHHVGGEVGLAEFGRAAGGLQFGIVQAEHGGEVVHQGADALGFIPHGAEVGLEGEGLEFGQEVFQFVLAVFADEVGCVREAGSDDVFVALHHGL